MKQAPAWRLFFYARDLHLKFFRYPKKPVIPASAGMTG
jgi:hypothetical protein